MGRQVDELFTGDTQQQVIRLALAVGIGLLLGLERERRKGEGPARSFAGIRTFALAGLLGGVAAHLGTGGLVTLGAGVAVLAAVGYGLGDRSDPGITTEVALLLCFALGALAQESPVPAAAAAVAATAILAARTPIHRFATRVLTEEELEDALIFAAAAVVVLPLLPDRGYGPYGILNPFRLWLFVVLIMGVSGLGHVAVRALGPRFGLAVAGLLGGFVSATATVGAMGARARRARAYVEPAAAGAVLATVATVAQLAVVLAAVSPASLQAASLPVAIAGTVALGYGSVAAFWVARGADAPQIGGRAFRLTDALLLASLIAGVLLVAAAAEELFGSRGAILAAALAGFADAHAPAISAATLYAEGTIGAGDLRVAVAAAFSTNSLSKAILAWAAGTPSFAWRVWVGLLAVTTVFWAGVAIAR